MRRYDTFTPKAKQAFLRTVELAERIDKSVFICSSTKYSLDCEQCPYVMDCRANSWIKRSKTASEWIAWANEEIEEEN